MKFASLTILLGIAIGTLYGVIFSLVYPQVDPSSKLALLFGVLGLLTASAIVGIWSWWRAAKKGSQQGEKTGKKMPKKPTTPKRPGRKKRL
jgi:hypothetical protein